MSASFGSRAVAGGSASWPVSTQFGASAPSTTSTTTTIVTQTTTTTISGTASATNSVAAPSIQSGGQPRPVNHARFGSAPVPAFSIAQTNTHVGFGSAHRGPGQQRIATLPGNIHPSHLVASGNGAQLSARQAAELKANGAVARV